MKLFSTRHPRRKNNSSWQLAARLRYRLSAVLSLQAQFRSNAQAANGNRRDRSKGVKHDLRACSPPVVLKGTAISAASTGYPCSLCSWSIEHVRHSSCGSTCPSSATQGWKRKNKGCGGSSNPLLQMLHLLAIRGTTNKIQQSRVAWIGERADDYPLPLVTRP